MNNQNKENAKTIQELEEFWNGFSKIYSKLTSPNLAPLSISMLNMIKIENKQNILEIAVGPGYYLPHLIQRKNKNAKLYITDLSPEFLAISKKRIDNFLENPISGPYQDFNIDNLPKFDSQEKVIYNNINSVIQKANSENLVDFPDNSIDAYISSLCLQLTHDPIKMIKECYRVLQPGGQAIFSVWGDKEKSLLVDYMSAAIKKFDLPEPKERSSFHLNNKEYLIDLFKQNGFENILAWNQYMPANIMSTKNDLKFATQNPVATAMTNKLIKDEKTKQEFNSFVENSLQEILEKQHYPIGLDALTILVTKPINTRK